MHEMKRSLSQGIEEMETSSCVQYLSDNEEVFSQTGQMEGSVASSVLGVDRHLHLQKLLHK